MTGILIVVFYTLFWGGCWIISGLFRYKKAKNPLRRRKWVFFWVLMTPMYFHTFEYALLLDACSNAPVYYPKEKVSNPDILVLNTTYYENAGSFSNDYEFEYILAPHKEYIDKGFPLSLGRKLFNDFNVYQHLDNSLHSEQYALLIEGKKRSEIIGSARYGMFHESKSTWNLIFSHRYIYDFLKGKKITGYTYVHQNIKSESVRNYLTLIRMPECSYNHGKYKRRDLGTLFLLEKTFIKEEK